MATATLSPKPILHFPQVPADQISQEELAEFIGAQKTLEKLTRLVQDSETSLLARLRNGAAIQTGKYLLEAKRTTHRSPDWKDVATRLAVRLGLDGDAFCSRVIARTQPNESFSLEIHE